MEDGLRLLKVLVVIFVIVVTGWVLAVADSSECEGQVDVLTLTSVTRSGHFSHPVYSFEGRLDVDDCPSLVGCAPCDGEPSLQALKALAREHFNTGDRPIVFRFH
ncbi:MAG: hypothetical protein KKE73_13345 [Proteobacteria bacterium]|nr:hypothetical protein [Pseudomonadota bacterium]